MDSATRGQQNRSVAEHTSYSPRTFGLSREFYHVISIVFIGIINQKTSLVGAPKAPPRHGVFLPLPEERTDVFSEFLRNVEAERVARLGQRGRGGSEGSLGLVRNGWLGMVRHG